MSFDGSRECIHVFKNRNGFCQCGAYGPLGSQRKSFRELCEEKSTPISIGQRKRGIVMNKSIEYPPIESLDLEDMWGGLDFPPLSFPLSRDAVIAAGSAGAGMLLAGWGTKKVAFLSTPTWRAAASIVGGMLGGYLLYDYNRPAAAGLSAGMVGLGLATLISQFTKTPVALDELGYKDEDLLGLGDAVVDEETLLTGLNAGSDEDLFGMEDAETEVVAPYEMTGIF